jgi:hypothetical protein
MNFLIGFITIFTIISFVVIYLLSSYKEIKRNLIYTNKFQVDNAYVGMEFTTLFIYTYVYKTIYKKRFNNSVQIKYEISQDIPLIQKPFFDGEYATNARLQTYAQMKKNAAKFVIEKDKEDKN